MPEDKLATTSPAVPAITEEAFDQIIQAGDFSRMTQAERSSFMYRFAEKMGLNPLTKPFDLIPLNGKLTIYANRTATDQLAKNHQLSTEILEEETDDQRETFTVKVRVTDPNGRFDHNIGSVGIGNLTGEGMSNAKMKAYTKAKRRAILAFTGLGFLDELEIQSIQGASEEAMAKRGVTTATVSNPNQAASTAVQIAAPEQSAPQVPTATSTPGRPLPPSQPPADVPSK